MTTPLREVQLPGPVPRHEIPGWRERYGVVAGITGREFDLGLWTQASVGEVMTRWRAFRTVESGFGAVILGNQVHDVRVARHQQAEGWVQIEGVDGHATATRGLMLAVTVADCIPVYLVAPAVGAIALLHSGWRGTAGGILGNGVTALVEGYGASPSEIVMHSGVGICGACYEVGREVMEGCGLALAGAGPFHADLRAVLAEQARQLGVQTISTSQWCSAHDRTSFYSHRASRGADGRMVAYLGYPST